jgi:hypothetical protein
MESKTAACKGPEAGSELLRCFLEEEKKNKKNKKKEKGKREGNESIRSPLEDHRR